LVAVIGVPSGWASGAGGCPARRACRPNRARQAATRRRRCSGAGGRRLQRHDALRAVRGLFPLLRHRVTQLRHRRRPVLRKRLAQRGVQPLRRARGSISPTSLGRLPIVTCTLDLVATASTCSSETPPMVVQLMPRRLPARGSARRRGGAPPQPPGHRRCPTSRRGPRPPGTRAPSSRWPSRDAGGRAR
jgi:hypothetical protein